MAGPIESMVPENILDVVAILEDTNSWSETNIRGFVGENPMLV